MVADRRRSDDPTDWGLPSAGASHSAPEHWPREDRPGCGEDGNRAYSASTGGELANRDSAENLSHGGKLRLAHLIGVGVGACLLLAVGRHAPADWFALALGVTALILLAIDSFLPAPLPQFRLITLVALVLYACWAAFAVLQLG